MGRLHRENRAWPYRLLPWFLSFLLPAGILGLVYAIMGVYPFGERSVLMLDATNQYIDFFAAWRKIVTEGGSLLYSFSRGLGGNLAGWLGYHLTSPLMPLILLFPETHLPEAFLALTLLKTGLSGLAFSACLHYSRREMSGSVRVAFSVMYALMAYAVVYSSNIMWLDGLILLPLVILGLERLVDRQRAGLYMSALAVAIFANFYIGFIILVFTSLYFLYYRVGQPRFFRSAGLYLGSTLFTLCGMAFLLLPVYLSLKTGKISPEWWQLNPSANFLFLDILAKIPIGAYDTITYGLPNIFCGTLTLLLLPAWFCRAQVPLKRKLASGALLIFLLLSFHLSTLNILWHGLQTPMFFPFRFSFVYAFFILTLAAEALKEIRNISRKGLAAAGASLGIALMLTEWFQYDFLDYRSLFFTGLAGAVFLALLFLFREKPARLRVAGILLLAAVTAEMTLSTSMLVRRLDREWGYVDRNAYTDYIASVKKILKEIPAGGSEGDPFYRVEKTSRRSLNDNLSLDLRGMTHYSSLFDNALNDMLQQLGFAREYYWHAYNGSTHVTDALFAVKYILSESAPHADYLPLIPDNTPTGEGQTTPSLAAYVNPYALPLAFLADPRVQTLPMTFGQPLAMQDKLLAAIAGAPEGTYFRDAGYGAIRLVNVTGTRDGTHYRYARKNKNQDAYVEYTLTVNREGDPLYAWFASEVRRECELYVNESYVGRYFTDDTHVPVDIGVFSQGDRATVRLKLLSDDLYIQDRYFRYLDLEALAQAVSSLRENALEITRMTGARIEGTIQAGEGGILFTSIPYDKGWTIRFGGGEPAETFIVAGRLLGAAFPPGEHRVELTFFPPGLKTGLIISGVAGLVILAWLLLIRRRRLFPGTAASALAGKGT